MHLACAILFASALGAAGVPCETKTHVLFVLGAGRADPEIRDQDDYRILAERIRRGFERRGCAVAPRRVAWESAGLSVNCAERLLREPPSAEADRPFHDRFLDVFCEKLDRAGHSKRGFVTLRKKEIRILEAAGDYAASLYGYLSEERREPVRRVLVEALRAVPRGERIVLVTHSLGSVMALDALRDAPDVEVALWVAFASPARDLRRFGWDVPLHDLPNVARWMNVYDSKDVLASPMEFEDGSAWQSWTMRKRGRVFRALSETESERAAGARVATAERLRVNLEVDMKGELYKAHVRYWKDKHLGKLVVEAAAAIGEGKVPERERPSRPAAHSVSSRSFKSESTGSPTTFVNEPCTCEMRVRPPFSWMP